MRGLREATLRAAMPVAKSERAVRIGRGRWSVMLHVPGASNAELGPHPDKAGTAWGM